MKHNGRLGGIVPDPDEVWVAMKDELGIATDPSSSIKANAGESISKEIISEVIRNLNQMVP